jgi:asparagine synthase (glutamine-hydrolysing)
VLAGDDPIADPAGQGYFAVARAARDAGVRVLLQGQGADELFWGYRWLRHAARASREIEAGEPLAERMVFHDCTADFALARSRMPVHYTADFRDLLDEGALSSAFTFPRPWPPIATTLTRLACATYLIENGIAQGDRLSMASSVELRLPFADHRLVETVVGLRKTQPDDHLPPKAWLRHALDGLLPAEVLARPKRAFGTPMRAWQRALFARHGDSLRQGFLVGAGILDGAMVEVLARGGFAAREAVPISFKALVLETWCRAMAGLAGVRGDDVASVLRKA